MLPPVLYNTAQNTISFFLPTLFHYNRYVEKCLEDTQEKNCADYPNLMIRIFTVACKGMHYILGNSLYISTVSSDTSGIDPELPLRHVPSIISTPLGIFPFIFKIKLIFDGTLIKQVLRNNRQTTNSNVIGGAPFERSESIIGNSLFTLKNDDYRRMRKFCNRQLSEHSLLQNSVFQEQLHQCCEEVIERMIEQKHVDDVLMSIESIPFDAVVKLIVSSEIQINEIHEAFFSLAPTLKKTIWPFAVTGLLSLITHQSSSFQYFVNLGKAIKKNPEAYDGIISKLSVDYDAEMITSMIIFLIEASHATTSMALTTSLFCLAKYPEEADELYESISQIEGTRKHKCEKLTNFINEVLRLYPSIPIQWREVNPQRDNQAPVTLGDEEYEIEEGSIFVLQTREAMRKCEEGERFCPYRFKENKIPDFYFPFSTGPNDCVGRHLAMTILETFLFHFVRKAKASSPSKVDFTAAPLLTLTNPLSITVYRR